MKSIFDMWLIQIEITNACILQCANCTRFVGHHRKPFFMRIEQVEKAIDSLEGYRGGVGIMGGEPTLHPEFEEICRLVQKKIPIKRRGLWTSGYKWKEYKRLIYKTFGENVFYNDHTGEGQKHQPLLIGIQEVLGDRKFAKELIDKCWIQERWSASITPKGGFFCEVAAAMDLLFEEQGGYSIVKGWWNRTPNQFQDQVERYCFKCSGALPLPSISNKDCDYISPANFKTLQKLNSPKLQKEKYVIYENKFTKQQIEQYCKNWRPWEYLGDDGQRSVADPGGLIGLRDAKTLMAKLKKKIRKKINKIKNKFIKEE